MPKSAQGRLEKHIRSVFPADTIGRVSVLEYGDDPAVEPGDVGIRVTVARVGRPEGQEEDERIIDAFKDAHDERINGLREKLPRFVGWIEFHAEHGDGTEDEADQAVRGPVLKLAIGDGRAPSFDVGAEELTPVMTRLGTADVATVDMLITAGIASSRAEALRWAVGRIRENPAYEQLQQRVSEINDLKNQF
jgi:hypothetical protein